MGTKKNQKIPKILNFFHCHSECSLESHSKMNFIQKISKIHHSSFIIYNAPKHSGFSLIELLVVIVTSAIVLSAVLGSFASLINITQKIDISRQLQKEIHFTLVRIGDKMRTYSLDYEAYESGACQGTEPQNSQKVCLQNNTLFAYDNSNPEDKTLTLNGERLFSRIFDVQDAFFFYITPPDPNTPKLQPKLTVYLDVASKHYPDIQFQIQTTISSRQYQQ